MFRPSPAFGVFSRASSAAFRPASKRFASTVTSSSTASSSSREKPRSWKNTAVRLGLAIGAVYYYNTSTAFAEHPLLSRSQQQQQRQQQLYPSSSSDVSTSPNTLNSIKPRIRDERTQSAQVDSRTDSEPHAELTGAGALNPADLEEEASHEAAFNPETGEINWDCPCLGGMAHGPCGEEFKAAFSCFVYSNEEPKGMECIDRFKDMQDCFRAHPDVYSAELEGDDEDDDDASIGNTTGVPSTEANVSSHADEGLSHVAEVKPQANENENSWIEQAGNDPLSEENTAVPTAE